jgi:hypothetical protein
MKVTPAPGARLSHGAKSLRRGLGALLLLALVWIVWGGPRSSASVRARTAPAPLPASRPAQVAPTPAPDAAVALPAPPPSASGLPVFAPNPGCANDMVLVSGEYCTQVEHVCKRWLDDDLLPYARCAEYEPSARCTGKRQTLRFCIDRFEYTKSSETLPTNYSSFVGASKICESLGRRICTESEWNFACEGPEMQPYPYGWSREPVCNQDRTDLFEKNPKMQVLRDHRVAAGSMKDCKSPFGVYDMTGNLDEPVLREAQRYEYPFRNGLKGGWWMAGRNRCRAVTTAHNDHYRDIQIGVRCCRDVAGG